MKGLKLKWCPFEECFPVTYLLKSHLTHKHFIKPGALLHNYLHVTSNYQDKSEVEEMKRTTHHPNCSTATNFTPPLVTTSSVLYRKLGQQRG